MKSMSMMKKLVLAAAVVCAVVCGARAEMLWWTATGIESSPGKALSGEKQYLAYIFADTGSGPTSGSNKANMFTNSKTPNPITSFSTVLEMLANSKDITDLAYYNATSTVRTYDSDKGRLNSYSADSGTASYEDRVGWIGIGGTVNLFAVILDGTSFSDSEYYMIATTTDNKQVLTQKTTNNADYYSSGMKNVYFDWGSQANNTWHKIGTVPEPTSGLLLLVGVAALTLKRKKAA